MTTTLQDAIAAARAGEMERAHLITADVIRDNPDDPNAWYLLSQLVDSDARRAVYLAKTLELDPDHPRARQEYDELPPALHERIGIPPEPVLTPPVAESTPAELVEALAEEEVETPIEYAPAEVEVEAPPEFISAEVELTPAEVEAEAPDELTPAVVGAIAIEAVESEAVEVTPEPVVVEPISVAAPVVTAGLETPDWAQPVGPATTPVVTVADLPPAAAEYQPPAPVRPVAAAVPALTPTRRNTANQALTLLLGLLLLLALLVVGMLAFLIFG
jgi:hypothetical protein